MKLEVKDIGLNSERLEELRPLLSEESFQNITKYRKQLEQDPPRFKGGGVYNPVYDPRNDKELQEQNYILKDRIAWLRQLYMLQRMENDFISKENKKQKREIEKLRQEVEELRDELKRAHLQLHSFLGIKNKSLASEGSDSQDSDKKTDCSDGKNNKQNKKRGAPFGHEGHNRPIPDKVDEINSIAIPDFCPRCGSNHILERNDYISKYTEDIVKIIKWIRENRYHKGICCNCSHEVVNPEAYSGPQVIVGPNIIALLTVMRQQMGVSYRKLSRFSTETLQLPITPSGVLGIINRVCSKLEPFYKTIEVLLRKQAVLFGDETGWWMDGIRWYIWCFCNRYLTYFHADKSRGSKVPKAILGKNYSGILHADFYAAYNFIKRTQRCLVHLQRDIKDELQIVPEDKSLVQLKEDIKEIIQEGNKIKMLPPSTEKDKRRVEVGEKLDGLTLLESDNKKTSNLIKRIKRYQDHLLRFIDNPEVEYHNNRSERTIRWAVLFRKISFGNRTPQGAYNQCVLSSSLDTIRKNDKNLTESVKLVYSANSEDIKRFIHEIFDTS